MRKLLLALAAFAALALVVNVADAEGRGPGFVPGPGAHGLEIEKRVHTQVPLEWPTVDSPVSSEVVHFVRAWVLEFCLLDREDPAGAAQLRGRFGFSPDANMFNCSQIFPGAGFTD